MGVKYAHQLTHSIKGLSIGNIETIAKKRFVSSIYYDDKKSRIQQPTIDVDVSWLYRSKNKIAEENRMSYIVDICLEFCRNGMVVVLVCDGSHRHHSKRASIERRAEMYNNMIQGLMHRSELMRLHKDRISATTTEERERILSLEQKIAKTIKQLEEADQQASKMDVGDDFYLSLCAYIDGIENKHYGNRNGKFFVIKSKFQADSVIAQRLVNGISDIAFCNDSDLATLAGKECISISRYKISSKKINNIEIFVACESAISLIKKWLAINDRTHDITIELSVCPVFDGVDCPRCRALIAVSLGCDVYPSGVRMLKKAELYSVISENIQNNADSIELYNKIFEFVFQVHWKPNKKKNISVEYISDMNEARIKFRSRVNIFVDAILFEPSNYESKYVAIYCTEQTEDQLNKAPIYINNTKPLCLHKYIEDFAGDQTNTPELDRVFIYGADSELSVCVGPGNGSHVCLSSENLCKCSICNQTCCYSCVFGE